MQYTYDEAVRELSDFLGKHVTADNYWKMEQVLLTVLRGDEKYHQSVYEEGQDEGYTKGYEAGVDAERDSWSCK
jgi:hypothetical protein